MSGWCKWLVSAMCLLAACTSAGGAGAVDAQSEVAGGAQVANDADTSDTAADAADVPCPPECDDGNPCTEDFCSEVVLFDPNNPHHCTHVLLLDGASCGTACGVALVCSQGNCEPVTPILCDDGNKCTSDTCAGESGCAFTAIACNDGNTCTDDACDPAIGCTFVVHSGSCMDGSDCTVSDTCLEGQCIGTALDCDDGNACTADSCSSQYGCKHFVMSCPDGNVCTSDACDPVKGCTYAPTSDPCTDGSACTVGDVCTNGKCVGTPMDCDDGAPCTLDSCYYGVCKHVAKCVNTSVCTTTECSATGDCIVTQFADNASCGKNACASAVCLAGVCTGETDPCLDSDPCTADICDAASGKCSHTPQPCAFTPGGGNSGVCATANDCVCFGGGLPPCFPPYSTPSEYATCDQNHRCDVEVICHQSQVEINGLCPVGAKLNCGGDSGFYNCETWACPPTLIDAAGNFPGCMPCDAPGAQCGAFRTCVAGVCKFADSCFGSKDCPLGETCLDGLNCSTTSSGPPKCKSNKDCPEDGFCKGVCYPDVCNGGACIDDFWPNGGMCFACASDGSALIGDPINCKDGDPCTAETWSPSAGCGHVAKADGVACSADGLKKCQKGICK